MRITDKLSKAGDVVNVYLYDNGYMVEVSGRTEDGDWGSAKILCTSLEEVAKLIQEAKDMERD
jgi:hypothetical protein